MGLEVGGQFAKRQEQEEFILLFNQFARDPKTMIQLGLGGLDIRDVTLGLFFKKHSLHEFEYPVDKLQNIDEERLRVASVAEQVLDKALFQSYQFPLKQEDYLRIRKSIINYYLLTTPSLNPDQYPTILSAEAIAGIKHIGRTENGQKVWVANEKSSLASQFLPVDQLRDFEKKETIRWFEKCDGLLDHIFVAAEPFIVELLQLLKAKAKTAVNKTPFQKALLNIDPFLYGIKMLFHDDGRKISQHRVAHEIETQRVLTLAGVREHFREEPAHPVVGREITSSFTRMEPTEKNVMQLLFYFADCVAKVNSNTGKLRRPQEFDVVFQNQSRRYTKISSDDTHAKFEEIIFGNILFWLQDHQLGLDFSIEELMQVYEQVESGIKQRRAEIGIVD